MPGGAASTAEKVVTDFSDNSVLPELFGKHDGNLALIASDRPLPAFDAARVSGFPVHAFAREAVARFLGRPYRFAPGAPALLLCDDFNPLDVRDAWLKERIRRDVLANTDWDVLS